jgi:hypothetical protein
MVGWIGFSDAVWKIGDGSGIAGYPLAASLLVFIFVDMTYA